MDRKSAKEGWGILPKYNELIKKYVWNLQNTKTSVQYHIRIYRKTTKREECFYACYLKPFDLHTEYQSLWITSREISLNAMEQEAQKEK